MLELSGLAVCLGFSMPERTEKVAGLWFASGISTQADTMPNVTI